MIYRSVEEWEAANFPQKKKHCWDGLTAEEIGRDIADKMFDHAKPILERILDELLSRHEKAPR